MNNGVQQNLSALDFRFIPTEYSPTTAPIETLKLGKLWIIVGTKRGLSERFLQMSERRKQAFMRFFKFCSDCSDTKNRG